MHTRQALALLFPLRNLRQENSERPRVIQTFMYARVCTCRVRGGKSVQGNFTPLFALIGSSNMTKAASPLGQPVSFLFFCSILFPHLLGSLCAENLCSQTDDGRCGERRWGSRLKSTLIFNPTYLAVPIFTSMQCGRRGDPKHLLIKILPSSPRLLFSLFFAACRSLLQPRRTERERVRGRPRIKASAAGPLRFSSLSSAAPGPF